MTSVLAPVSEPVLVSEYREFVPPLAWGGAVRCRWEQRVSTGTGRYRQRVIPDGHADLLVGEDGVPMVVGPATEVSLPAMDPGSTVHGIRLAGDRVRAVLGVPAYELTDQYLPLAALAGGKRVRAVCDAVGGDARALAEFDGWFATAQLDPRVSAAAGMLWRGLDVAAVADRVGLSGRQLRRALLLEVGLGPKTYQRIGRLQRFLALVIRADAGLAELADRAGYADQPHLTREARALSGLTAAELWAFQRGC